MAGSTTLRRTPQPSSRNGFVRNGESTKVGRDNEPEALGYLLKLCVSATSGLVFGFAAEKARGKPACTLFFTSLD